MPIDLNDVIPLGRRLFEYQKMFGLTDKDEYQKILDCGAGPSSFNCEMAKQNRRVVSIDPIYRYSRDDIKRRIDETFEDIIRQAEENRNRFVWRQIKDTKDLAEVRMGAMEMFLADYEAGKKEGRYLCGELPELPFEDDEFDLALSSHFLFLYSKIFSLEFHIKSIAEMLRVAKEARIFPLLGLDARPAPHLPGVVGYFKDKGVSVDIRKVDYEFQRGGNEYLCLKKQ
jgi:ubiquinone/menaquinone biosynthesis C-methylase UbiE